MDSSNPSDVASDSAPLIFGHQKEAYQKLVAIGRACFGVQRDTLPLDLKCASLLVGPSSSGKSFLAAAVATELGVPFCNLAVSHWVILTGSDRGAQTTWVAIADFLRRNRNAPGVVIFIDELDKQLNQSSYDRQAFVESLLLLDGTVPRHLKTSDGIVLSESELAAAQDMLKNRTFLIAAGAFQELWNANAKPKIGFADSGPNSWQPTPNDLSKVLGEEIIGRFRGNLVVLQPLEKTDYIAMLELTAPRVPACLRDSFLQKGYAKIPKALTTRQGCRFLEEVMLEAILHERSRVTQTYSDKAEAQSVHSKESGVQEINPSC